jgi:hypothetical protein
MTRKDYIAIANAIIMNPDIYDNEYFMSDLCNVFSNDNKKFDKNTFENYIEEGIKKEEIYNEALNMIL